MVSTIEQKKMKKFSKSIFMSCRNMKKDTKILVLSWESWEDKKLITKVVQNLKDSDLVNYTAGFSSIKLILTVYGKLRITDFKDWYD